jgi:hypothetical protein
MKMTVIKIGARTVREKHLFQKEKGLKGERKEKCSFRQNVDHCTLDMGMNSTLLVFAKLPVMDLTTGY